MDRCNSLGGAGQVSSEANVSFYAGMEAEVLPNNGDTWRTISIVEVDAEEKEVLCRYKNGAHTDEWICVDSCRIRPTGAMRIAKSKLKPHIQISQKVNVSSGLRQIPGNFPTNTMRGDEKDSPVGAENYVSNSLTSDSTVVFKNGEVNVTDTLNSTYSTTHSSRQCADSQSVQVKVERDDVHSTGILSSTECTFSLLDSSHARGIIIKKEEDLGIVEEEYETPIDNNFSLVAAKKENWKSNDDAFQAEFAYNRTSGGFTWDLDADSGSKLFSPDTGDCYSLLQKSALFSEAHTETSSGFGFQKCTCNFAEKKDSTQSNIKFEELACSEFEKVKIFSDSTHGDFNSRVSSDETFPESQHDTAEGPPELCIDSLNCPCIFRIKKFKVKKETVSTLKKIDDIGSTSFKTAMTDLNAEPACRSNYTSEFRGKSDLDSDSTNHTKKQSFSCEFCPAKLKTKFTLKFHLRTHTGEKPFSCPHCPAKFMQRSGWKRHLMTHSDDKPYVCKYCPAKFNRSDRLKVHMGLHVGEQPSCSICPAKFRSWQGLAYHSMTHTGKKPYTCSKCPSNFKCTSDLKRHARTHSDEKPFLCKLCPAKFAQSGYLKAHLVVHSSEKPFVCTHCLAKFSRRESLRVHLRTHTNERPYICTHCPAKFARNGSLKEHLRIHTGERPHLCTHCDAKFTSKSSLLMHLRIHANKRLFKCTYCPSRFNRNYHLKIHLARLHTDVKQFSCEHCAAVFKTKKDVKKHLVIHLK